MCGEPLSVWLYQTCFSFDDLAFLRGHLLIGDFVCVYVNQFQYGYLCDGHRHKLFSITIL